MNKITDVLFRDNHKCISKLNYIKDDVQENNINMYDSMTHHIFDVPYEAFDCHNVDPEIYKDAQRKRRTIKQLFLHIMYNKGIDKEHIDMIGEFQNIPDLYNRIMSVFVWTPISVIQKSCNNDFVYPDNIDVLRDFSMWIRLFISGTDIHKILDDEYSALNKKED